MTTRRDEYVAAWKSGRAAPVGSPNPYYGQGLLARLWRAGNDQMLAAWVADAPRRQAALRAQHPNPNY